MYLPLFEVADTPFHFQGDNFIYISDDKVRLFSIKMNRLNALLCCKKLKSGLNVDRSRFAITPFLESGKIQGCVKWE